MREIKFRAWDAELKKMLPVNKLHLNIQKVESLDDSWDWYKRDRPIMQYTGLKDKNGKEIYEGDRLKIVTYFDETHEVVVREEDGAFIIDTPYTEEHDCTVLGWHINNFGGHTVEVIGNIYENPELIETTE